MSATRWTHGDAAIGRRIEALLATPDAIPMGDSDARSVRRVNDGSVEVVVKRFRVGTGRHVWRERFKAAIGRAPALREWNALVTMRAAGIAVPEPLALGTLPDGDRLLVMRRAPGVSLADALRSPASDRAILVTALGLLVRRLHEAGFVHGDLHAGNVMASFPTVTLLDWQHARRTRSPRLRKRDLARLEFALSRLVSSGRRLRLRKLVLGDGASDDALRAAGRAFERRAREHARSRTRAACRPGPDSRRIETAGARGLAFGVDPETLAGVLAAHRASIDAGDARVLASSTRSRVTAQSLWGRSVIVKEAPYRGVARALVDLVRGSAAARGWRGAQGLIARRIGAAHPIAYLERRVCGVPVASWLVLEDLRPAPDAASAEGLDREEVLDALVGLAIRLHRAGVDHGDLKATHMFLRRYVGAPLRPYLVDLDGVRFRRSLSDERRLHALAQLNASLPDAFSAEARCRAFARYAAALPFACGADAARREVVRESLARAHRWTGAGCADAKNLDATPAPPRATGSSSTSRGSCRRARGRT